MVEGYYNCPILAKNVHYLKDSEFKEKSLVNACYFLDENLVQKRSVQDTQIPSLDDVFHDINTGADDETELSRYMNIAYDEAIDKVHDAKDKTTVLSEDISSRWKKTEPHLPQKTSFKTTDEDWWMSEDAFNESSSDNPNPFDKK